MNQFVDAYKNAFIRYADFSGRTSVGGYWRFVAIHVLIIVVLTVLGAVSTAFIVMQGVYLLALLIPSLAIAVRRLHDTGKSGWFILFGLIPIVGFIIQIVFYVQASDGPNQYGQASED